MNLDELYKIKVDSYRDFRNHLLSCFNAYTVSVGVLGYFAFEAHANKNLEQFRVLWLLLVGLLTLAVYLSRYYVRHAQLTAEHVESLSRELQLTDMPEIPVARYAEDGAGMRAAMRAFAPLNFIAW
jgi:hypothetical protein